MIPAFLRYCPVLLLLTACAAETTLTENECRSVNWYERGWNDAKNDVEEPHKQDWQRREDGCGANASDDCGKRDSYRNPGEALAKIDFSRSQARS